MSKLKVEVNPDLKEKYTNLLKAVIDKKPVDFKSIFEEVMRVKATDYVSLVKEEMHKGVFNEESKFDKLAGKLSHEKGVTDPKGLAYAIGKRKFGKKGMEKKSEEGKDSK